MKKDLFGQAIYDYYHNKLNSHLITETDISEEDEFDVSYLFRDFDAMPTLEQLALKEAKGRVLDVGAGAGSHALYLQNTGLDVTALDQSAVAIEVCKKRGIKQTVTSEILNFKTDKTFDTILLLMNGTGIFQTINQVESYLEKLKTLLTPKGKLLIDSSDIIYMFDQDDDGGLWLPAHKSYYGELEFTLHYRQDTESFPWLYLAFDILQSLAETCGLSAVKIADGKHYDYLCELRIKD